MTFFKKLLSPKMLLTGLYIKILEIMQKKLVKDNKKSYLIKKF